MQRHEQQPFRLLFFIIEVFEFINKSGDGYVEWKKDRARY